MRFLILNLLVAVVFTACKHDSINVNNSNINFNYNWQFAKNIADTVNNQMFIDTNNYNWEQVSLPHTANIEPLVIKADQWQGICFYRKFFTLPANANNKHVAIQFDGAMQIAHVYLNNKLIYVNYGGYLPFYVDITNNVNYNSLNSLVVMLDNRDNPQVPPGKPIRTLDFNIYSGIYRNVSLIVKNKLHITNAVAANKTAGGGVFVTYNNVSAGSANVNVSVDVANFDNIEKNAKIGAQLFYNNKQVAQFFSNQKQVPAGQSVAFNAKTTVEKPMLWSPNQPNLYTLIVNVYNNNVVTHSQTQKIGIRTFSFNAKNGFIINGKPLKIRGTNRHQEYPYIGYALSDNANYRDAYKIKQAGFNFVRLSHYPQSKAFLNACDELGILVMDAIPGWQFFGDTVFQQNVFNDIRAMVRRDRNHPCIVLWEASLNESGMTENFMQQAHNIVHNEYPGPDVYTCGWLDGVYDVFIPARQHAKPPFYWNNYLGKWPLLIAEYGDWEYYAQNAGFNQTAYANLTDDERNSRQLRGHGQKRLAQQALNYQESHNSNLQGIAIGDANWLMFDYNRGYAPDIEASGIMDIFRLPKFAYYFYKSQAIIGENIMAQPMVFISNFYNDPSFLQLKVYSNCQQVELFVNNKSFGRKQPDTDINSVNLTNPPFTFVLNSFEPGQIVAKAYVNNNVVATHTVNTPEKADGIKIWHDQSGRKLQSNCNDAVFLYAAVIDKNGTVLPHAADSIKFTATGDAVIIGQNPAQAEAGIATVLLKAGQTCGKVTVGATSNNLKSAKIVIDVN